MRPMQCLLRYPGGKYRVRLPFCRAITGLVKGRKLTSLCVGGGGIELELARARMSVVAYDTDDRLVNFYVALFNGQLYKAVIEAVKEYCFPYKQRKTGIKYGISKECHNKLKPISYLPDARGAAAYYILNRTSVGGGMEPAVGTSTPENQRFSDGNISELLRLFGDISVQKLGFEESIKDDGTFIYCDPPYADIVTPLYHGHDDFNHELLAEKLLKRNAFMLSYGDNKYIKHLYKSCHIFHTKWIKGRSETDMAGDKKKKNNEELIILSPDIGSYGEGRRLLTTSGFQLVDEERL